MSSIKKQPAASLLTNPQRLAGKRELYSDLYRAGVRRQVPQAVIYLLPNTVPMEIDDVESLSQGSEVVRDLLDEDVPQALEVTLNQRGTDRLHKLLRSRRPLPERAVIASAAMFLALMVLPLTLFAQSWSGIAVNLTIIAVGFVVRRMSINHTVAGIDVDGEDYPSEGLNGVTHPAFGDIMIKLAELAELQNVSVLEHPFLSDLQTVADFVRDTNAGDISDREKAAISEEATSLIDIIATRINDEIQSINAIRESTERELSASGADSAKELLAAGDQQINDVKIAGIRDRADILRKLIEEDKTF